MAKKQGLESASGEKKMCKSACLNSFSTSLDLSAKAFYLQFFNVNWAVCCDHFVFILQHLDKSEDLRWGRIRFCFKERRGEGRQFNEK